MWECERCGGPTRVMVMMQVSAPSEMYGKFSKKNMNSKDFTIWGVNWDGADFICTKCGFTTNGYRNYVTNLKEENDRLKALLEQTHNKRMSKIKLSAKRRAELLVSAKILDEDGNYHKDYFSEETVAKSKQNKVKT